MVASGLLYHSSHTKFDPESSPELTIELENDNASTPKWHRGMQRELTFCYRVPSSYGAITITVVETGALSLALADALIETEVLAVTTAVVIGNVTELAPAATMTVFGTEAVSDVNPATRHADRVIADCRSTLVTIRCLSCYEPN